MISLHKSLKVRFFRVKIGLNPKRITSVYRFSLRVKEVFMKFGVCRLLGVLRGLWLRCLEVSVQKPSSSRSKRGNLIGPDSALKPLSRDL